MKERINKCIKELKKRKLDAFLTFDAVNITYLTGFRAAWGYLLITVHGGLFYFTNFLYAAEARQLNLWKVLVSNNDIFTLLKVKIKSLKLQRVGFEAKNIVFLEYKKIKEELLSAHIEFSQTQDLIEDLRAVKSPAEIVLLKKSIKISEEAFVFAREIYDNSMTEKELSIEVERFLRLRGDNEVAFPPIVAGGSNSSFPHYPAADIKLDKEFFLMDLGSKYCGYCADLTRVFFWGKMPFLFRKIHDIVTAAADCSLKVIKAGVRCRDVDQAARQIIEKKGYGAYFGHGLGHGIGLSVHERPFLGKANDSLLKTGMVVTIEPAIYLPGKFGIRIENMVLVKKTGAEVLSGNTHW